MKRFFIFLLRAYQGFVSPVIHTLVPVRSGCRFHPTCSEYMISSVREQGVLRGLKDGLLRLSHCHPITRRSRVAHKNI